ncbi:MAG TPA: GIDE domain-containing protein [Candidatus Acidoferrales bacterium]|nr:GIDE domain-containing protein [Candidatus Acidoferrales bacterium]
MAAPLFISHGPAGMLAAVACVIVGGPWFADGLHALRQRRLLRSLRHREHESLRGGFGAVRGAVDSERPIVAPLSGRACAGFVLEVRDDSGAHSARLLERHPFVLHTPEGDIAVDARAAEWELAVGLERRVESVEELGVAVQRLLERSPELRWLKARGGPLRLTERVLPVGAEAFVLGERARDAAVHAGLEWARTGTDDVAVPLAGAFSPLWSVRPAGELGLCVVSDRAPSPERLAPPLWRAAGALLGPALALAGLLILAGAAAPYVDGRF